MEHTVPFSFILHIIAIGILIYAGFSAVSNYRKRALDSLLEKAGLSYEDLDKVPENVKSTWRKKGVSKKDLVHAYRRYVENTV